MKKFFKLSIVVILLSTNAFGASDGDLKLTKKNIADQTAKDCFETLNRATFALNQGLDKLILKPVAKGYRTLPSPIRTGTGNVLNNLSNLITIPNNVLQGEFGKAGINSGRLIVNSTIGILGIFDVAHSLGFPEYQREDYGQTLGRWGVGPGCYLVLPVLGPTTVRDTAGSFINILGGDPYYNASVNGNNEFLSEKIYMTSKILTGIDFRAKNIESLDNLEKNSMDFYASVRSLYLQDRKKKIYNSTGVVETMDDSDWEEIDTK
jgi:phospholipid-binding lipoprotein MlaA